VSTLGQTPATSLVGGLLPGLDTALGAVLSNVEVLVAGVLELVSTLCVLSARMSISFADGLPTASSTSRASSRTLRSASPLARLVSKRLGCTHPSLKLEGLAPTETVIPCCIIDHKAYQPFTPTLEPDLPYSMERFKIISCPVWWSGGDPHSCVTHQACGSFRDLSGLFRAANDTLPFSQWPASVVDRAGAFCAGQFPRGA
jgi:hypothetical protein